MLKYTSWQERTRRQSRQHLRDRTKHSTLWQANDFMALAIERDGRLIGDIAVHLRNVHHSIRSAEIGWLLVADQTGRGFASEAVSAVLQRLSDSLQLRSVHAFIEEENAPSAALARRLGFTEASRDGSDLTFEVVVDEEQTRAWRCVNRH